MCTNQNHELLFIKNNIPIIKCKQCSLVSSYVSADINPKSIYNDSYFNGGQPDGYVNYEESEEILKKEFARTLEEINQLKKEDQKKILEIGCAYGFFLDLAKKNYEVYGIEIADDAVKRCIEKGLQVFCGEVNEVILNKIGKVDFIIMFDVIEHLPDPSVVIKLLNAYLNNNGYIIIVTGNYDSLLAKMMKKRWRLMTPPQHLYFFSRKTLSKLLVNNGFRIISINIPSKIIPLGLAIYQFTARIGLKIKKLGKIKSAVKVNLYDVVKIIAQKV